MKPVLIVDDEFDLVEAMKATLEKEGYVVEPVQDCREVFKRAKQVQPSLVITDLMMPFVSGYEVILGIRDLPECKETRVLLTSSTEPTAKQSHFRWDGFLKKPFDKEALTAAR